MSNTHIDFTTPEFVVPGPSEDERFFYEHAAYSWGASETEEEGHWRCARMLRQAELHAEREGWHTEWYYGGLSDTKSPYHLKQAILWDADGEHLASLGEIDLGPNGHPDSDPYARVVAAELAWEAMSA